MSRLETGLDAEKLLAKSAGGVGSDLLTFCPPSFVIGLDSLVGSTRVTWEEVCSDKKAKSQNRNEKSA